MTASYDPAALIAAYARGTLDLASLVTALRAHDPVTTRRSADPNDRWFEAADLLTDPRPTIPLLLEQAVAVGTLTRRQSDDILDKVSA